ECIPHGVRELHQVALPCEEKPYAAGRGGGCRPGRCSGDTRAKGQASSLVPLACGEVTSACSPTLVLPAAVVRPCPALDPFPSPGDSRPPSRAAPSSPQFGFVSTRSPPGECRKQ